MYGRNANRAFWGLILIGLGAIFMLEQLDLITLDIGQIFSTYWPVLIIALGLKGLMSLGRYGNWGGAYVWNLFIIAVGTVFLLKNIGVLGAISYREMMRFLGPAILVVVGLGLLLRPSRNPYHDEHNYDRKPKYNYKIPHPDELSGNNANQNSAMEQMMDMHEAMRQERAKHRAARQELREERQRLREELRRKREKNWHGAHGNVENRASFFGDIHIGMDYWELKPLNISQFIGDTIIDLTRAQIPYGETTINISSFIGDVKVLMPYDSDIEISVTTSSFLGEISVLDRHESGLMRSLNVVSAHYADAEKKIRLRISMFIGDVKVERIG
ncbi:MAG TPA: cell wall-active antibiotics response protein LiaF [Bacilli bacterium]